MKNKTIDDLLSNFDLTDSTEEDPDTKGVTFWLPLEYKTKYDLIQERSKRKFGKILKEILKRSIDKICVDEFHPKNT